MMLQGSTIFTKKLYDKGVLTCNICKNVLTPPIYLQKEKGNVCQNCINFTLMSEDDLIQNTALEFVLNELAFPCQFHNQGCKEIVTHGELDKHERDCKFRTIDCWMIHEGCKWKDQPKAFVIHFLNSHEEHIIHIKNDLFIFNININDPRTVKMLKTNFQKSYIFKVIRKKGNLLYTIYATENLKTCENLYITHVGKNAEVYSTSCPVQFIINKSTTVKTTKVALSNLEGIMEQNGTISLIIKNECKQVFDKKLLEHFECPVCKNLMRSPIYQCKAGHSFCHICKPKLHYCPTCRGNVNNLRNYSLEALAQKLIYECKNKAFGCNELLSGDEIEAHEEICYYFKQRCPLANSINCRFEGNHEDIGYHFTQFHNGEYIDGSRFYSHFIILPFPNFSKFLIDQENNIFCFKWKHNSKGLECHFKILQNNIESVEYICEVGIKHPSQNRRRFIKKNIDFENYCFSFDDIEEFYEKNPIVPTTKRVNYYCKIECSQI